MSTSSAIAGLQQALNCASTCDCCDRLQSQINALNDRLNKIPQIDVNAIVDKAKYALIPVIGGIVVQKTSSYGQTLAQMNAAILDSQKSNAEFLRRTDAKLFATEQAAMAAEREANLVRIANAKFVTQVEEVTAQSAGVLKQSERDIANATANAARREELLAKQLAAFQNAQRLASIDAELAKGIANQAALKAGTALNQSGAAIAAVAETSKTVINTVNDVTGLRGVINGIGSRVDSFGRAIARAEQVAGQALAKAAGAIGISEQALGAIGKLALRVGELFNIIGTFATLFEQLATLNVLGGRIDSVERELQLQGNSISGILGKLLGLQNRIGRNEATISDIKTIAVEAQRTADVATNKAQAAYVLGGKAESEAKQAQLTADGAVRNASIANDNAITAYKQGIKAENIGQQALQIGGDALGKAGIALSTALTAISLYQSVKALRGLRGLPGIPGQKGDKGDKGDQGIQGLPGVTTVVQIPGIPGKDGKNGAPGVPGRNGRDVNPADLASLRALIVQQHGITRTNINATTTGLFGRLQAFTAASTASITALMTTIATNTYVEKAMQLLTLAATLHNAAMLSNNLAQTLGTIINQCVGFILPKGINGQPINITDVIGHTIEDIVKQAIGNDNYTTISQDWAKANRIYQAGANVFNQIGNAVGLVTSGLEVIGGNIGKIGNALKIWGVVGQHAYSFMNPQPNMKGKFFDFINNASAEANTIQMMVAIPIGLAAAGQAVNESVDAFSKTLDQTDPVDEHGNPQHNPDGSIKRYQPGTTVPDPAKTILQQEQAKADSTNIIAATIDDLINGND